MKSNLHNTVSKGILCVLILSILSSCASNRSLVYLKDLDATKYRETITNKIAPIIQPDDLLSITVSSLNPESNILFNSGVLQTAGSTTGAGATTRVNDGYLVDKNGFINFPVLGRIDLAGLTKEQATDKMTAEIKKSVKNPIINIKFLNFRVTVIGEVRSPSTFTILNERINLVEALALAGDLTIYGKKENILVIRESNNVRTATRIDLSGKSGLDSPAFYLQQNDIVYVEPIKSKSFQTSNFNTYIPIVSFVFSTLSIALLIFR